MSIFDPLVQRLVRMEPIRSQILAAGIFLALLSGIGTIGYRIIEQWSLMDGLYMTFLTLSTIGFGEVRPMSPTGRIFTMIIGFLGIVTMGFIIARTAQQLVARQRLKYRHMQNQINRLKQHYIICGYGRIGSRIARDLAVAGESFVVIEIAEPKIKQLEGSGYLYIAGSAEEEVILQQARIDQAKGLITTLNEDSDNVFVTLIAREANPDLLILARAGTSKNVRRLYRAGADKVIPPYEIGADRMARVILRPHVDRFLEEALDSSGVDLSMEEIMIEKNSFLDGKSLAESDFRNIFGAIVVGIVNGRSREITFNPSAQTQLNAGDFLILLGDGKMIERVREGCHDANPPPARIRT